MNIPIIDFIKENNLEVKNYYSNPQILNIVLNQGREDLINDFNQLAWNEENINLFLEKYPNFKLPIYIVNSPVGLKVILKKDLLDKLYLFTTDTVNEENINLFMEKCQENKINKIPYAFNNTKVLATLIENNLLYHATLINYKSWNDEIIKLFCNQLDYYKGELNYSFMASLNNSNILYALIKNKRYENLYYLKNWDEKCINLFIENIDDYLKAGYNIPYNLRGNCQLLKKLIKEKYLKHIPLFEKEAYDQENIYEVINLIYKDELKYNDISFDIKNIKEVQYMLKHYNYNITCIIDYENRTKLRNILNSSKLKEYQSYARFLLKINSQELYDYINILINNNDINKFFDENGPKPSLYNYLIFNYEYQLYCKNNNIDITYNINDKILLNYLKIINLFPNLHTYIYIDKKNYQEYFNEEGPKLELYEFLFNPRACELLYKLNNKYPKLESKKQLILDKMMSIESRKVKEIFIKYCIDNYNKYNEQQIDNIYKLIKKIENSNSSEIRHIRESLTNQLLEYDNPEEKFDEIEKIFLKKNIPHIIKVYYTFKIMHPDYKDFDFSSKSSICPSLKISNDLSKDVIIFTKLLYAQLGSNNYEFKDFLFKIAEGYKLYMEIKKEKKNNLTEEELELLKTFKFLIELLYNSSYISKKNGKIKIQNLIDLNKAIEILKPKDVDEYYLPNRIVSMFCHNAGFDTIESIINYINNYQQEREEYHKKLEQDKDFILKEGYLVKGINYVKYLDNLAKYGICCKEMLGDGAGSDATKLDTDVARIKGSYTNNKDAINNTVAKEYGHTFLVFKVDDKCVVTRDHDGIERPVNRKNTKMEVFKTGFLGEDHYGIGVAAAFSDIEYIITDEYNYTFGVTLAINNIYVPIVDMNGKLLFTYKDFINIRNKMQGLSYYNESRYIIANDVVRNDIELIETTLKDNKIETDYKRSCIINALKEGIELKVKTYMDGDLTPGSIEIIDTGSTGRGTNVADDGDLTPGSIEIIDTGSTGRGTNVADDGDFDFIIRLDQDIIIDEKKLTIIKKQIAASIGKEYTSGDFRYNNVNIKGLDLPVDIDITFTAKSNKIEYTTEECIKDRLNTIKNQYPDKYNYVLANIILAKQLFKKYECYKPKHASGGKAQGGLGGVGVENWILQNGGSLIQAANNFLECAQGKTFKEFINNYPIYDFGINHLSERNDKYPYDNYIFNLDEDGYKKILTALNDYVNNKVNINEDIQNFTI